MFVAALLDLGLPLNKAQVRAGENPDAQVPAQSVKKVRPFHPRHSVSGDLPRARTATFMETDSRADPAQQTQA